MTPIIVANWKMQLTDDDAIDVARRLAETVRHGELTVVLCPPFTALRAVAEGIRGSALALGAQDCAFAERGALTGEVSPADLVHLGCRYVILGHSERRHELGETDAMVARKVRAALGVGLTPILCVGETAVDRDAGRRDAVVRTQVRAALDGVALVGTQELYVAYEPVWAIGTGRAASPADAAAVHALIHDALADALGASGTAHVRILYGGSVDPANVKEFLAQPHTDGVLVGTAGQTAARLRNLIAAIA